jgi:hypothetical protein
LNGGGLQHADGEFFNEMTEKSAKTADYFPLGAKLRRSMGQPMAALVRRMI